MFFYKTWCRHQIIKKIRYIFSSVYESSPKIKIGKYSSPLVFTKYQLALIFDVDVEKSKQKSEMEKAGLKVFVISENESIEDICRRLIYVLHNLDKNSV